MTLTVRCRTDFDITATGVKSNFHRNRIPFTDSAGTTISDMSAWHRSRNQQRNWETINQIISLRTLPEEITVPERIQEHGRRRWQFSFQISNAGDIALGEDPVGLLKQDCFDVPMLIGLDEETQERPFLVPDHNIIFQVTVDK